MREHMTRMLERLGSRGETRFSELVTTSEGRLGVVVSFLAILELAREALITLEQDRAYAPLTLRLAGS